MRNLQINWFDLVAAAFLIIGLIRGRKRGMSMELLPVFQALLIVALGGEYYELFGNKLADVTGLFSYMSCYIAVYLGIAMLVQLIFGNLKRLVGDKLVGSDLFGGSEYYLGMFGGAVRWLCYLLMFMAIIHAPAITPEQVAASTKAQTDNIGISFPTFGTIQQDVFGKSETGKFVTSRLGKLLIKSTSPEGKSIKLREGPGKKLEHEVDKMFTNNPSYK